MPSTSCYSGDKLSSFDAAKVESLANKIDTESINETEMISVSMEEPMQTTEEAAESFISETAHALLCVDCSIKQERIENLHKLQKRCNLML